MRVHPASQIILYTKGHFQRGELFKDLRVLVGDYVAVPTGRITCGDILQVLCDVALPFLLAGPSPKARVERLLLSLGSEPIRRCETRCSTPSELVALELLGILQGIQVKDGDKVLINLGKPNYSLLDPPPKR